MTVAGILAAICDSLIPGTPEERGIKIKKKKHVYKTPLLCYNYKRRILKEVF